MYLINLVSHYMKIKKTYAMFLILIHSLLGIRVTSKLHSSICSLTTSLFTVRQTTIRTKKLWTQLFGAKFEERHPLCCDGKLFMCKMSFFILSDKRRSKYL
jgi:hypothetical protein